MNGKKIAYLAVIVAALLLYISQVELKKDNEKAAKENPFVDLAPDAIQKITLKNPSGTFALVNGAPKDEKGTDPDKTTLSDEEIGQWKLEGKPAATIEGAALNTLVASIRNLKLEEIPSEQVQADRATYGLASPTVEVGIATGSNQHTIRFGDQNEVLSQRYVAVDENPTIYLAPEDLYRSAIRSSTDFRQKLPIRFADRDVLQVEQQTKLIGDLTVAANDEFEWTLQAPGPFNASEIAVGNVLREIRNIRVSEFIDDKNPSEFGLDSPSLHLRLTFRPSAKREPLDVLIAVPEDTGNKDAGAYMTVKGVPTVYRLATNPIPKIARTPFELREKHPLSIATDTVQEIKIESAARGSYSLVRSGDSWTVGGKPGDTPFIDQLLRDLADLEVTAFPEGNPEFGFGTPSAKVSIVVKEGTATKTHVLTIGAEVQEGGKKEDPKYYADVDGSKEPFILAGSIVKKLTPAQESLVASEAPNTPTPNPEATPAAP